jgi:DNA polymerase-3 subunit epsilon
MGYISKGVAINDSDEVKSYVTPYKSNQYIDQLIFAYAEKYPHKVFFNKHFAK